MASVAMAGFWLTHLPQMPWKKATASAMTASDGPWAYRQS